MTINSRSLKKLLIPAAASWLLFTCQGFAAETENVLHNFTGNPDGAEPLYSLVSDSSGNLYGTTPAGGSSFEGDVFQLSRDGSGGWVYSVIHTFTDCNSGCYPAGPLTLDDAGNLYGAASAGGSNNNGTIFELTPTSDGSWSLRVLYNFPYSRTAGYHPNGVVYFKGGFYGTAFGGGTHQGGVVFSVTPNADGSWSETVLHNFAENKIDGGGPMGGVILDSKGNIYGTTSLGGPSQAGTVFELVPKLNALGTWEEHILHNFNVADGASPWFGSLIFDKYGNLYGTTVNGGAGQYGTVFELTRSGNSWTETVLHNFSGGDDGAGPNAGVSIDSRGRLYGTTLEGGGEGDCTDPTNTVIVHCGTAFVLTPTESGTWRESFLHRFADSTDGGSPAAGVVLDANDNVYGLASGGGTGRYGVVFELSISHDQ